MPDRDPLEEASREEAAERAHQSQPVIMERGPGEAIVEPVLPAAPGLSDAFTEPLITQTRRGRSPSEIIWSKLKCNRTAMFGLYILAALYLAAVLAGFIAPYQNDTAAHCMPFHPPMLSRMLVGGIAGYFGGVADFLLMRGVEALLAVPSLYFILILRQMFGGGLSSMQLYLIIVVILAFIGWATEARVIRGMVLSLKEQEYVLAARALGFTDARIIARHILPNTLSFVIVTATLSVPFYILGEVALSFLGVGIQEPEASWGNLLTAAQNPRYLSDFPWMLAPGVFIFIAVMAWNFLGDGLRDATDPRTLN